MKFARTVFIVAGIWGLLVLTPLFFLIDVTGRQYAAPAIYPQFFYGFLSVAMAWQIVFLLIGSDPVRFRLFMLPSIVEKFGWVLVLLLLYRGGRIAPLDTSAAWPDLVLGVLFVAAFVKTGHD